MAIVIFNIEFGVVQIKRYVSCIFNLDKSITDMHSNRIYVIIEVFLLYIIICLFSRLLFLHGRSSLRFFSACGIDFRIAFRFRRNSIFL